MRVVGHTKRMEVILDTDEQVIWITQKWKCIFLAWDRGVRKWTEAEKRNYKKQLKSIIQNLWSDRAYAIINTQSGTPFNKKYGKINFKIKVNIEFTAVGSHWEVNIYKVKSFSESHALVDWDERQASLTNFSIRKSQYGFMDDSTDPGSFFWKSAHEFGHMIGNTPCIGEVGDEYATLHPLYKDMYSIMHGGNEIRHRHFSHVRNLLQKMLPGSHFCIRLP